VLANAGGIQGLPLAAGAQDKQDAVHRIPVRDRWVVTTQGVRLAWGQQGLHLLPQLIGNAPTVVFNY
jgi:hypothetical protein